MRLACLVGGQGPALITSDLGSLSLPFTASLALGSNRSSNSISSTCELWGLEQIIYSLSNHSRLS